MYNPGALTELALKNGAKIKRSMEEIHDAILASPQAKITPFKTPANFFDSDASFEVQEGSDTHHRVFCGDRFRARQHARWRRDVDRGGVRSLLHL